METIGHLLVLSAILFLIVDLDGATRSTVGGLMMLNAVCLAAITLISERHPDNVSDEPGAQVRFTGAVLLVTVFWCSHRCKSVPVEQRRVAVRAGVKSGHWIGSELFRIGGAGPGDVCRGDVRGSSAVCVC